ncbi:MAG: M48 family metalloprotease [Vulcanimicrobiaceae bacterium]
MAQAQAPELERLAHFVGRIPSQTLLSAPVERLLDVRRQHLAEALVAREPPLFFGSAFCEIAALLYLWRSGRAAQIRDVIRRNVRNIHLVRLIYVWMIAMLAQAASFPAAIVAYRLSVAAGTSVQSPAEWLGESASTAVASALMSAVIFWFMLLLAARTRYWYFFGAAFLVLFVLLASFAEPVVYTPWIVHQQTLHEYGPRGAQLYGVEKRMGVRVPIVIEGIGAATDADVDVSRISGLGPTAQIDISDTLMSTATPNELNFVVARESAHIAAHDVLRLDLYASLWLIVAAAISVAVADRIGFRRDDDPLSRLALLGSVLGVALLALLPIQNAYSRRLEARADHVAVAATADPASAVRLMVRLADVDLLPACPKPIVRRYFLVYPPIASRIAAVRGGGDPCP